MGCWSLHPQTVLLLNFNWYPALEVGLPLAYYLDLAILRCCERLGIDSGAWSETVKDFGRLFKNVAGKSTNIEQARSLKSRRKFYQARV